MSISNEQSYYENPAMWQAERYLVADAERRRLQACAAVLPPGGGSLLDVGAGNGAFLSVVEQMRPDLALTGVERSLTAIDMAVSKARLHPGSIDAIPFEDRSFDIVASMEVIEHLPYGVYERSLAELERVARRWIMIEVPYREDRLHVRCPYCTCEFNPHYHMRAFDDDTMRGLFSGFRCVRLEKITTQDVVFGPVIKKAFRAVRRRAGFFPPNAVCPQCGFRAGGAVAAAAPELDLGRQTERAMRLGAAGRRLLPRRARALAVVGLYERAGA